MILRTSLSYQTTKFIRTLLGIQKGGLLPQERIHRWVKISGSHIRDHNPTFPTQAVAHSEDDNREVFVDANSVSDNGPRLPKSELASYDLRSMLATDKLT